MTARRAVLLAATFAVLVAGCTDKSPDQSSAADSSAFASELASTDLVAGSPQQVEVGLLHSDPQAGVQLVVFGELTIRLSYLPGGPGASPEPGPEATAGYLAAPETPQDGAGPALTDPGTARGVYLARGVIFDRTGLWTGTVTADVHGIGIVTTSLTPFFVAKNHAFPGPGDRALKTENHVMGEASVRPSAIDSRALDGQPIPDPELHRWTIARALAQHRPIVVLFATPTYCVSQFCGPTTDALSSLERLYSNRAVFIHVEIWRRFDAAKNKQVLNEAAADWLYRDGDLTEPWLYLIGADGIIKDRWGPLFDVDEVGALLDALPPMQA